MMLQDHLKAQALAAKADEALVAHDRGAGEGADVSDDSIVRQPFVGDELIAKVGAALSQSSQRSRENVVRLRS